jgi:hypothetical protein
MYEPFIFIAAYKVRPGQLEQAKKRCAEVAELVEANEPRLISFNLWVDESASRVGIVQIHPDAASMGFHLTVISHHLANAWDWIETTESQQAYGIPPDSLTAMVREYAESLTVFPDHLAGFTRARTFATER